MNWDHTGINIVPGYLWTMEEKGAKRVDCVGLDDKRKITILSGNFLPFQVIYQGKTPKALLSSRLECDFHHWSNEERTQEYIREVHTEKAQRAKLARSSSIGHLR